MRCYYYVNGEVWTDLDTESPELQIVAGPKPLRGDVDIDCLPDEYRRISETEYQVAWPQITNC